jgi:hypothetical protein
MFLGKNRLISAVLQHSNIFFFSTGLAKESTRKTAVVVQPSQGKQKAESYPGR